ncbi:MAG: cytochrome c peroxidase [Myxococcota bacterium]|jgi:cytochrome c peroxidase
MMLALAALGAGCEQQDGPTETSIPWKIEPFPTVPDDGLDPVVRDARSDLGRILFFDPILSADSQTACGTCHSEIWGMSDGLPRSIGHGAGILAGPGRKGGPIHRRNAPHLWNLAFRDAFFRDGRETSLEVQALAPMYESGELDRDPEAAVAEMRSIDEYVMRFEAAFPGEPEITIDQLASALATFQRGLVSDRALYDAYVDGDAYALNDDDVAGMQLFAGHGCANCHAPPLFETDAYYDRGVPGLDDVDGIDPDEGRYEVTGLEADRNAFRVPSLRNVIFADPFFHDGSVTRLEDAVRHELEQGTLPFDDADVRLITAFVTNALNDERLEPQRPKEVPSGLEVPFDGTVVIRF